MAQNVTLSLVDSAGLGLETAAYLKVFTLPAGVTVTGLTRDGTFLVENGKVSRSIKNFRFNDSPLFMLNNLEALGRPQRLAGTEAGGDHHAARVLPQVPRQILDLRIAGVRAAIEHGDGALHQMEP